MANDDFDRSNAALSSPWVASPSSAIKIVNNALEVITTSNVAVAGYNVPLGLSDHTASFTVTALPAGSWAVIARANSSFTTYYGLRRIGATSGFSLYKNVNGTTTVLATASVAVSVGETVTIQVFGSDITGFVGGKSVLTASDSSITSGEYVGLRLHGSSVGTRFDDFETTLVIGGIGPEDDTEAPTFSYVGSQAYIGGVTTSANIPAGSVRFTWLAATDNVAVAGYEISKKIGDVYVPFDRTSALEYTVAGLASGSKDSWRVKSFDTSENLSTGSAFWLDLQIPTYGTTTPDPDPAPTPTANADNFNQVDGNLASPWNVYPAAAVKVVNNAAEFLTTGVGVQAVYGRGTAGAAQFARVQISNVSGTIAVIAGGSPATSAPGVLVNYYGFRRVGPSTVSLIRVIDGAAPTVLSSISAVVSVGDTIEIQINAAGTEVSGWVNGTRVLKTAITIPYTNYNYVGVRSTTNAQGFRFDEFITGVPAGSTTPAPTDTTAPPAPSLSASSVGQTSAVLTASEVSDSSGVAFYRFYKNSTILATQTGRTYSVSGLTAGTTYTDYAVSAIDNAGNISQKSTVVFKTLAASTTPTPTGFQWSGKSFMARGDSSGNVQGTTGTDFDNYHTWPGLVARGWADTPNPSVPDPTPYPNGLGLTIPSSSYVKNHTDNATAQDVFIRMLNGSTRWTPGSYDIVSIFVGGNDVGYLHDFPAGEASYRNSLSAILGLLRANSSPVQTGTTTGTWSTPAVTGSGKAKVSTNPGDTFTYTFSGSNATFLALAATSGAGSNFTYQLDGGATVSKTTKAQSMIRANSRMSNSNVAPVPVHFRNLSSGSHTLKITHTGSAGDPLVVDSVLPWLTSEADMPFVLMVPPGLFSSETTGGAAGYPDPDPNNEDVYRFRSILDSVLAEFSFAGNVGVVSADLLDEKFPPTATNLRIKDGLHPNLQGNKVIADVILESLAKYPTN
jgi:hypothetical protein